MAIDNSGVHHCCIVYCSGLQIHRFFSLSEGSTLFRAPTESKGSLLTTPSMLKGRAHANGNTVYNFVVNSEFSGVLAGVMTSLNSLFLC